MVGIVSFITSGYFWGLFIGGDRNNNGPVFMLAVFVGLIHSLMSLYRKVRSHDEH